tara:strand:+ start:108 stop:881 length:774 start_codon:yes stop_codon:yes gene_type:complete
MNSQQIIDEISLPKELNETSALEFFKKNILTLNDSGGQSILYEFNSKGEIVYRHKILGIKNNDWESLAKDNKHIFIGDIGNNYGTRSNLSIIKVKLDDLIVDGIINIKYKAQNNFDPNLYTEFDAEAITNYLENLLLFTKNRKSLTTEIYLIPKTPGDYIIEPIGFFEIGGLITGADYDEKLKLLVLIGYESSGTQFMCQVKDFNLENIKLLDLKKYIIKIDKAQMEGIKIIDKNTFWISSEDEGKKSKPRLFKVKL